MESIFVAAQVRVKPLHASTGTDESQDPYACLHEQSIDRDKDGEPSLKQQKRNSNPFNYFSRNWEHYWHHVVLPTATEAQRKIDLRMEWPSIWECKEIILKQMALAQEGKFSTLPVHEADQVTVQQAEDMIKDDTKAQAYLKDRLSLHEYACYIVRDVARNLDAFGTAKAAPKTKTYAMDVDAAEDPAVQRVQEGTAGGDFDGDMDLPSEDEGDGTIRLKPGEAPPKVYHPLSMEQRRKALSFHRERTSKFVKDMIAAGLLPLTKDEKAVQNSHKPQTTAPSADEQQQTRDIRKIAGCLPTLTKEMLEMQRDAFDAKKKSGSSLSSTTAPSTTSEPASSITSENAQAEDVQAHWKNLPTPSKTMEKEIACFEANAHHPDPEQRTFILSDEQKTFCTWFSQALDGAFDEEVRQAPMTDRHFARATSCGYVCVKTMLCAYLSVLMCAHLSAHVCTYVSVMYVRMHVFMYVCMYVCMHGCMYVCKYV